MTPSPTAVEVDSQESKTNEENVNVNSKTNNSDSNESTSGLAAKAGGHDSNTKPAQTNNTEDTKIGEDNGNNDNNNNNSNKPDGTTESEVKGSSTPAPVAGTTAKGKKMPPPSELPKEWQDKISPFNPNEKHWKSQEEFLIEAKTHLGKMFGINRFSVDDCARNQDPDTKVAFPRKMARYICGSCRGKRDLPTTTQGCCGFRITTHLRVVDSSGTIALVVTSFVLPPTSLHVASPPPVESNEPAVIDFKADLTKEQIKLIIEQGEQNAETAAVHQILAEKYPGLKVKNKLVRTIMKEGMRKAGIPIKSPAPIFQVPADLKERVSPFNPEESKWYSSHEDFLSQAKSHLEKTFGISKIQVYDCEKNKDPKTKLKFPYYRVTYGCSTCKKRIRDMPKEQWGCCGFLMRCMLRSGKNKYRPYMVEPHMVVREFVLTTNSVHSGHVPGAPKEIDKTPKRRMDDLTDDQLSLLKCFGRRRMDAKTIRAIMADAFDGLELNDSLLHRVLKKGRLEGGENLDHEGEGSNIDKNDDKEKQKDRYNRCSSLCRQISSLARQDPEIFDMAMPQLSKLANKCVEMGNTKQETKDDHDEEDWCGTDDDLVGQEPLQKKARTSFS